MLSRLTLANPAGEDVVIHEDAPASNRLLTSAQGLVGIGPLRQAKRIKPQAHGSINETHYEEGRTIQLAGEVFSNVSIERALEEFRAISAPMLQTLDYGPAWMKWQEGVAGLALQMLVKLDSDCEPILQEAAAKLSYPVSFFATDPRAYTQQLFSAKTGKLASGGGGLVFPAPFNWQFIGTEGHNVTIAQPGNRGTPLIFRVYGEITNPRITRISDGQGVTLTGVITDGNYLEVNSFERTMTLNGVTNSLSFLEPVKTSWTALEAPPWPGEELYTLTGENYDSQAYLEVLYRGAYA